MTSANSDDTPSKVRLQTVSSDEAGQRLDNYLSSRLKGVPRSMLYRIIRKGEVRVNKGRCKADQRLQAGDVVRIPPVRQREESEKPTIPTPLIKKVRERVLHEDKNLLVLNKPAGLAVHGGSGLKYGLVDVLAAAFPDREYLQLAHRLDRDTSGCLLLAKNRQYLRELQQMIRDDQLTKRYQLLVTGHWNDAKTIRSNLKKGAEEGGERRVVSAEDGKPSRTRFTPLQHFLLRSKGSPSLELSLMEADLRTGRTHQIRVQAMEYGYPLAGDDKYGQREENRMLRRAGLKRMFLHAHFLQFDCPVSGETMVFSANLDEELKTFLDGLGARPSVGRGRSTRRK